MDMTDLKDIRRKLYISVKAHRGGFIFNRHLGSNVYLKDNSGMNITGLLRDAIGAFPFCELKEISGDHIIVDVGGRDYLISGIPGNNES